MNKQNTKKQQRLFDDFPNKFFVQEDKDENDIFHEKTFIGTELGGDGHRLRNYVVISTKSNESFSTNQKQIINDTFAKICQKYDSQIETIKCYKTYALIQLLVSMDIAIGEVIDKGIIACNKKGDFLRFHYYVTNVKRPTVKDMQEYLRLEEVKYAE